MPNNNFFALRFVLFYFLFLSAVSASAQLSLDNPAISENIFFVEQGVLIIPLLEFNDDNGNVALYRVEAKLFRVPFVIVFDVTDVALTSLDLINPAIQPSARFSPDRTRVILPKVMLVNSVASGVDTTSEIVGVEFSLIFPEGTARLVLDSAKFVGESGDLTLSDGDIKASTTFSGFPKELAADRNTATSWFSKGSNAESTSTFSWTALKEFYIEEITLTGNGNHRTNSFRTGFGFGIVTIKLLDKDEKIVYQETQSLAGTPDPTISVRPKLAAAKVILEFGQHESEDCGGFSELSIIGRSIESEIKERMLI